MNAKYQQIHSSKFYFTFTSQLMQVIAYVGHVFLFVTCCPTVILKSKDFSTFLSQYSLHSWIRQKKMFSTVCPYSLEVKNGVCMILNIRIKQKCTDESTSGIIEDWIVELQEKELKIHSVFQKKWQVFKIIRAFLQK